MKNFIFISPNFPENYWEFCVELKNNGLNVLGIGDAPYGELRQELKNSLTEYYKVSSLENYDEVYRAVAFFAFKYGRTDYLESNNEYWLERDSHLRDDFNICSGFKSAQMEAVKYKSKMKEYYIKAGIPVARYYLVENMEGALKFIDEVGYPVIAKPDNGVGANDTYKINNKKELEAFFDKKEDDVLYIMEEFIYGTVNSYDAIVDSKGNPLFETGNVTIDSLVDVVNTRGNSSFYIRKELPDDVRNAGRATLKSFGVKSRFVHFEFFRLYKNMKGLGKKNDIIALEVNMRPSGGISPSMMNYAHSTSVYKIYADMIAFDSTSLGDSGKHANCAFAGRRYDKKYKLDHYAIYEKYAKNMIFDCPVQEALSGAMGDYMYVANFDSEEELTNFYKDVFEPAE